MRKKKGATPIELLAFVPILGLLGALAFFWSGHFTAHEASRAARNVAEIRASHTSERGQQLEESYFATLAKNYTSCEARPSPEEWYPVWEQMVKDHPDSDLPVSLSVSCIDEEAAWSQPQPIPASQGIPQPAPPENAAALGAAQIRGNSCVGFEC